MVDVRITFEWQGLEGVRQDIDRIQGALEPPSLTDSLGIGADIFVEEARGFAPRLTGALAESIDKNRETDGWGWVVSPFANQQGEVYLYAATQETGQIHTGNMRFLGRDGWVSPQMVDIPGTGYMQKAFASGETSAAEAIKEEIKIKMAL
jgi:hypothetical protein